MPDEITVVVEPGSPDILMFFQQDREVFSRDFPEGFGEMFCKRYFPLAKIGVLIVK